jgi:hypothetical protein
MKKSRCTFQHNNKKSTIALAAPQAGTQLLFMGTPLVNGQWLTALPG